MPFLSLSIYIKKELKSKLKILFLALRFFSLVRRKLLRGKAELTGRKEGKLKGGKIFNG